MINKDTWVISDTHFGHHNIIGFCNRPQNHEEIIFQNWRNLVEPNDTVLHLGDVALGKKEQIYIWGKKIDELPGKKYLIKGNHDHTSSLRAWGGIFEVLKPFIQNFDGRKVLFSHYPDQYRSHGQWDINIHGHIHNNPYSFEPLGHVNVSIEVMNYRPVKLEEILYELGFAF